MDISFNHYVSIRNGLFDQGEVENAFNKIGGICHNKQYDIRGEFRVIDSYIRTEYNMVYWKLAKLKKHLNELNEYYPFDRIVEICDFFMSDAKFDVANLPEYADLESNGLSRANNDVFLKYISNLCVLFSLTCPSIHLGILIHLSILILIILVRYSLICIILLKHLLLLLIL